MTAVASFGAPMQAPTHTINQEFKPAPSSTTLVMTPTAVSPANHTHDDSISEHCFALPTGSNSLSPSPGTLRRLSQEQERRRSASTATTGGGVAETSVAAGASAAAAAPNDVESHFSRRGASQRHAFDDDDDPEAGGTATAARPISGDRQDRPNFDSGTPRPRRPESRTHAAAVAATQEAGDEAASGRAVVVPPARVESAIGTITATATTDCLSPTARDVAGSLGTFSPLATGPRAARPGSDFTLATSPVPIVMNDVSAVLLDSPPPPPMARVATAAVLSHGASARTLPELREGGDSPAAVAPTVAAVSPVHPAQQQQRPSSAGAVRSRPASGRTSAMGGMNPPALVAPEAARAVTAGPIADLVVGIPNRVGSAAAAASVAAPVVAASQQQQGEAHGLASVMTPMGLVQVPHPSPRRPAAAPQVAGSSGAAALGTAATAVPDAVGGARQPSTGGSAAASLHLPPLGIPALTMTLATASSARDGGASVSVVPSREGSASSRAAALSNIPASARSMVAAGKPPALHPLHLQVFSRDLLGSDASPGADPGRPHYCPLCMMSFPRALGTACCSNSICEFCLIDLLKAAEEKAPLAKLMVQQLTQQMQNPHLYAQQQQQQQQQRQQALHYNHQQPGSARSSHHGTNGRRRSSSMASSSGAVPPTLHPTAVKFGELALHVRALVSSSSGGRVEFSPIATTPCPFCARVLRLTPLLEDVRALRFYGDSPSVQEARRRLDVCGNSVSRPRADDDDGSIRRSPVARFNNENGPLNVSAQNPLTQDQSVIAISLGRERDEPAEAAAASSPQLNRNGSAGRARAPLAPLPVRLAAATALTFDESSDSNPNPNLPPNGPLQLTGLATPRGGAPAAHAAARPAQLSANALSTPARPNPLAYAAGGAPSPAVGASPARWGRPGAAAAVNGDGAAQAPSPRQHVYASLSPAGSRWAGAGAGAATGASPVPMPPPPARSMAAPAVPVAPTVAGGADGEDPMFARLRSMLRPMPTIAALPPIAHAATAAPPAANINGAARATGGAVRLPSVENSGRAGSTSARRNPLLPPAVAAPAANGSVHGAAAVQLPFLLPPQPQHYNSNPQRRAPSQGLPPRVLAQPSQQRSVSSSRPPMVPVALPPVAGGAGSRTREKEGICSLM